MKWHIVLTLQSGEQHVGRGESLREAIGDIKRTIRKALGR